MKPLEWKSLRQQNTILAAKNFVLEMDNGATMEKLNFIASGADDLALFWHLISNPEEIPLQEMQGY
ncbi:MAG: hypothetical protein SAK29_24630 [Scytonema sp. PMC 1069.18]|nr:hypothetical protein [Scytonema sp. PMC 1069.18]MEC4881838.1 hypothetical protein [Scytonema sp. PMC 1070.18]